MKITKIYGGPGAGKTTRLVELIRAAVDDGTPVSRIAFISHTTAAADEAWHRVRDQLGVKFKPRFFCTIHSAAMNRAGITRNDVFSNWKEVSRRTRLNFTGQGMSAALDAAGKDQNRNGDHILVLKNFASSNMISIEEAKEQLPRYPVLSKVNITRTLRIFEEIKNEEKRFDFDDMLNMYNQDPEASALPVDIVFVDEAQDLSRLQWEVVHKLSREARRLYIVGDDDQAIYTFLGADPYGFLDHPSDETIILDKSWRCPANIGSLADKIIRQVSKRQDKKFAWKLESGVLNYHQGDPWPVLRDPEGSTMVLARHKKQCWTLSNDLDRHNIPHSINGESPLHGTRATRLRALLELREGQSVTLTRAADAVSLIPKQRERLEKMRNRARRDPDFCVTKEDIAVKWDKPWYELAAKSDREVTSNLKVRKHLNRHGLDILGTAPAIDISTIHAAKGREADHVVLLTDCYKSVWEEQRRSMESELRLAYVGVTRAKQKLTIVRPQTANYLRALV